MPVIYRYCTEVGMLPAHILLATTLILVGCSTSQGVKKDAHVVGSAVEKGVGKAGEAVGKVVEKTGEGLKKAGQAVERTGEAIGEKMKN
jgi:predicted small secreted protein